MKFYIRRAVVGVIALPLVAGVYVAGFAGLAGLTGDFSLSLAEVVGNGFLIGSVLAVAFTFAPQFSKFISKVSGE